MGGFVYESILLLLFLLVFNEIPFARFKLDLSESSRRVESGRHPNSSCDTASTRASSLRPAAFLARSISRKCRENGHAYPSNRRVE
jgi:hypothetical protein